MHVSSRRGFTLIELLVVIAIIAILAVVVILTLNPIELLRQSRDSNRLSDMSTLTSAINLYNTDQGGASGYSLGAANTVYVSLPDPTATSTAGDQCQGLGLVALPATYTYHCAASSTYRNVNGTGWIPVNLSAISSASPLGSLPVDPTNNSSSRLYYTYDTNGTQFETTAVMESQKYAVGGSNDVISADGGPLASVYEKGSKLGLEPLDYGDSTLVGYWPMDEGSGSIAYDYSGNNTSLTFYKGPGGSYPIWQSGKVFGALQFVGSSYPNNDGLMANYYPWMNTITNASWLFWYYPQNITQSSWILDRYFGSGDGVQWGIEQAGSNIQVITSSNGTPASQQTLTGTSNSLVANQWNYIVVVLNSGTGFTIYVNGAKTDSLAYAQPLYNSGTTVGICVAVDCGSNGGLLSSIDDARIYNRALSAAQIAAMYAGGK